ncbi:non capsid protein NS 1 [Echinococcus multilocularis]|uniref:Non capsid protein NS 1 n=1 Tax=Echinococcus multilocularis TaxID=6211 RepID=A0A0S4MQY7_ECHMU|nr:non capsid protein NS 1 [Echinococcus multilocularis]
MERIIEECDVSSYRVSDVKLTKQLVRNVIALIRYMKGRGTIVDANPDLPARRPAVGTTQRRAHPRTSADGDARTPVPPEAEEAKT